MTHNMGKKFLLVVILLSVLGTLPALGQKEQLEMISKFIKKQRINAAYLFLGGHSLQMEKLNNYLIPHSFPPVAESYFTYGVGGHVIHNKLVVGMEMQRTIKKKSNTTLDFNTYITSRHLLLNFGYLAYSNKGTFVYPMVGIGVGHLRLKVTENNIESFEDISNYQRGSTSKNTSLLLNVGFGLDHFIKFNKKKKGRNCLVFGLRGGYKYSALKGRWTINDVTVSNGPQVGVSGPYLHFTIGLGGGVATLIKIAI